MHAMGLGRYEVNMSWLYSYGKVNMSLTLASSFDLLALLFAGPDEAHNNSGQ